MDVVFRSDFESLYAVKFIELRLILDVTTFKIVSVFTTFFVALIGGYFAFSLANRKNSSKLFSLGNSFSGGIFLGAGLLHLLPDSVEGFSEALPNFEFPIAYLICVFGFILILFFENVLLRSEHSDTVFDHFKSGIYPYLLTIALSIHSIIAGIALGAESNIEMASLVLVAIIAHKGSAAFALIVNLFSSDVNRKRIRTILFLFSVMTPFGILFGLIATLNLNDSYTMLLTSTFDALAAGTFIYISILDIIHGEFSDRRNSWAKFSILLFGFGLMSLIALWF